MSTVMAVERSYVRAAFVFFILLLPLNPARAADVLTIGTVSAEPGMMARIPVHIRDLSGTALNTGTPEDIEEFSFTAAFTNSTYIEGCQSTPFPSCQMTFTPAGVLSNLTPALESISASATSINVHYIYPTPIPFSLDGAAPGNLIGFIDVLLAVGATPQGEIAFTIMPDPDLTFLRQRSPSTLVETVGAGLEVVGGKINVSEVCTAPPSTLAIAWSGAGCASPAATCEATGTIVFSAGDYTIQECDTVVWRLGDGTSTTNHSPSRKYPAGTYTIELTITNREGAKSATATLTFVEAPPTCMKPAPSGINWTSNRPSCVAPLADCQTGTAITFTPAGHSYQGCDNALWTFGDGTSSTARVPTKTYNTQGTYTVTLVLSNSTGTAVPVSRTFAITAGSSGLCGALPTQSQLTFSAFGSSCSGTECPVGTAVTFTAQSFQYQFQDCDEVTWNFGDNTPAVTGKTVVHTFSSASTYNVAMQLKNTNGSITISKPITITSGVPLKPACPCLASGPLTAITGTHVSFAGQTGICENPTVRWTFGDGTSDSSGAVNILHAYARPGTFAWQFQVSAPDRPTCVAGGTIVVSDPGPKRRAVRVTGDGR